MHKYAASLVGGKTIPRDVVVVAESKEEAKVPIFLFFFRIQFFSFFCLLRF
jgi:hypothetical protein